MISSCTGSSREVIESHLNEFATQGLRTLLLAKRHLTKQELQMFLLLWKRAENTINNDEEASILYNKATNMIEKDFIILGATAIEDRLQDNGKLKHVMTTY